MSLLRVSPDRAGESATPKKRGRLSGVMPWASLAARVIGAGVLAYAGLAKIGDPAGGVRAVRAYRILPEGLVHPVAYGLPPVEIVLAALLLFGIATRVVAGITAGLLVVFIAAVSSAGLRGLRIDCGCFGGGGTVEHTHYLLEIGRDSLLLLVILLAVVAQRSRLSIDDRFLRGSAGVVEARQASSAKRRQLAELRAAEARRKQRVRSRLAGSAAVLALVFAAVGGMAANAAPSASKAVSVVAPSGATAAGGIVVGSATAPLKLIAYEDPQCPVCGEFEKVNGRTLESAVAAGKISVEYRMRSFLGVESVRADNALAAAQQEGKFEELREALFAHQPRERTGGYTTEDLLSLGRSVGLDDAAFASAVRSMTYAPWVARVDDQASRDGNVGTPQLVIVGGKPLSIQQTLDPALFKAALGLG